MPREGAIIFRELVGKLEVLNVQSGKCGRRGRYRFDPIGCEQARVRCRKIRTRWTRAGGMGAERTARALKISQW